MRKENGSPDSVSASFMRFFSRASALMQRNRWLRLLFHGSGLGSLGAALFLQSSVFAGLVRQGYFLGVEQSLVTLSFEIGLTAFGVAYFVYLFLRFVFSFK